MARLSEHGIRLSSMSPSFLNSNSTSHTWPFSAVAELIDNASDPGVSAKQIKIDVVEEADQLCLTFTDNGSGMTPNKLHKMLSFGFTEKGSGKASQQAIGVYGNGFKSGSMRLGRDALIFTKNGGCQTVGMLSQTYLQNIKAQAVIVPIVPFNQLTKSMVVTEDSDASLAAILQNSIVNSQEQILAHFDSIVSKKGTKILIWNIRSSRDGNPEFDFDTETSDIRLPEIQIAELKKGLRNSGALRAEQNIPDLHYSLRAYLSILYLKPRTQIILRGKKILAKLVSKRLAHIEHDVYKPQFSKEKVKVTFGLNLKNKDYYGIMMYHRNRLIKAYEKVGCQLKTSGHRAGVGVIGVIECNFLKPAHNKQDFEYTKEYRLTLGALGIKLNDYWKAMSEKKAREREFQAVDRDGPEDEQDADKAPTWLQCEECLKWRSVAPGIYKEVPESWNCSQNPNARYRSCSAPEEAEDCVEVLTPSYQKNHKKQEHPKSRKRDKSLEDPTAEHQLLSRCSSEPSQPTFQSPHCPPAENAGIPAPDAHCDTAACTNDEMQTQSTVTGDGTQAQHRLAGRDTVIKEKVHMAAGDEDADKSKDTPVEPMEREIEGAGILSFKRKSGSFYVCVKKPCVRLEQLPDLGNMSAVRKPETATNTPQLLAMLEKKTTQDISSSSNSNQVEKALQRTPGSGLPWTSPLPSTQTVVVSPLSRTEGPRSRTLPSDGGDREGNMQKLAVLEKEVQRLRRLLGQEISKTTQGTMTVCDTSAEKPGTKPPASTAGREVGCQTDEVESSTSSSSESRAAALQGLGALTEKHKSKKEKKTEAQSKMKASDSEACEDSRSAQENLHDMRNNVLVLLTALLPQLDLAGISLETTDIDSILQQIIEVNSLKV